MWISKKELIEIKTRLRELEHTVARLEYDTQIWITSGYTYGKPFIIGEFRGNDNVLLSEIIRKILDHLKLKIIIQQYSKKEQFILRKIK